MFESICALMMLFSGDAHAESVGQTYNKHLLACMKEHLKGSAQEQGHYFDDNSNTFVIPVGGGINIEGRPQKGFLTLDSSGYSRFLALTNNTQNKWTAFTVKNSDTKKQTTLEYMYKETKDADGSVKHTLEVREPAPAIRRASWLSRTQTTEVDKRLHAHGEGKLAPILKELYKNDPNKISTDCNSLSVMDLVRENNRIWPPAGYAPSGQ